ncbi:O-antigen translocase [Pseudomonas sp. AFG_SD02_1510_Pfu_092]|uniref:O-antigen translocase n=1 Tax=Pseudomonas sp. AFG_SD02_1510_Pfu_092 TaxID=2259497 RepID=UPI000DEEEDD7|nr:O-antigen translocase [Pseudomonas sp. AFG_SD02_1510_Pfu_092]RCL29122.1 O-antigen translocase [Pseudomonas sp. AFG_SD02_1510_Pfu_092]
MTLIKTSLLNAIAVFVKMATLLGLNKVLALYVGPAGYAAIGQLQNAVTMFTTLASGAVSTGVTKYTAEFADRPDEQHRLWRTAGTLSLLVSCVLAILIVALRAPLAGWFFNDQALAPVLVWFAATLVFFAFNSLLLGILNGKKDVQRYVLANILGSLISLVVTCALTIRLGLYGALVSLAVYQSLSFVATLVICMRTSWFRPGDFIGALDRQSLSRLAKFALMAVVTACSLPVCHVFIRDYLGTEFGWDHAGYWEAMWRLSTAYLMLITTTLAVYYLPRLSELCEANELRREIIQGYKLILPLTVAAGLVIYLLRDFIIHVLFSESFLPMRDLFAWQMVGDSLKVVSWLMAYLMLGKALTRLYLVTEILSTLSLYALTVYFTQLWGYEQVTLAYAANYLLYGIVMYFSVFRRLHIIVSDTARS